MFFSDNFYLFKSVVALYNPPLYPLATLRWGSPVWESLYCSMLVNDTELKLHTVKDCLLSCRPLWHLAGRRQAGWLAAVTPQHFDLVYSLTLSGTLLRPCDQCQSVKALRECRLCESVYPSSLSLPVWQKASKPSPICPPPPHTMRDHNLVWTMSFHNLAIFLLFCSNFWFYMLDLLFYLKGMLQLQSYVPYWRL